MWLIDNIPFLSDLFDLIFVAIDNIVGDITQVGYCFGNGIEIYGNPLPWALSSCIDDKQFDCDMHECFDELLICMEKNATGLPAIENEFTGLVDEFDTLANSFISLVDDGVAGQNSEEALVAEVEVVRNQRR